jgi:hypothetical protein
LMKASLARIIHFPIGEIIVAAGFVIVCHWSLGLIRHSSPHRARAVGRPSQPGSG